MRASIHTTGIFRWVATFLSLFFSAINLMAQTVEPKLASDVLDRVPAQDGDSVDAIYWGDSLNLNEGEKIIFNEPARVYVDDLNMGAQSWVDSQGNPIEFFVKDGVDSAGGLINVTPDGRNYDTSGQDGQDGVDGEKAMDGLKGSSGAHGSDGTNATNGVSANDILIMAAELKGDIYLLARGGAGGRGGNGGDGGRGGAGLSGQDARVLYNFKGIDGLPIDTLLGIGTSIGVPYVGQVLAILSLFNGLTIGDGFDGFDGGAGGDAGHGGNGGNGGDGGNINVVIAKRDPSAKLYVNTQGGRAGVGGRSGVPGAGGQGGLGGQAGDIWGRDGNPGNPGATGAKGVSGTSGTSGRSGKISWIETPDQKWFQCYLSYRQIIDTSGDYSFAKEVLKACMGY